MDLEKQMAQMAPVDAVEREERRSVTLSGWLVRQDESTWDFQLLDLSCSGCKILCEAPLGRGEPVRIAVLNRGVVDAEVRWRRSGFAGLRFSDVRDPESKWPRRTKRTPIRGTVRLKRSGRRRHDLRIFDLSTEGCRVEFLDRPAIDEIVWVKLDGIETLEARVRWTEGFVGGLRFSKTLHPAVLGLHLASYTPDTAETP